MTSGKWLGAVLLVLAVGATAVFLFPLTRVGFVADESLNSTIDGYIAWHGSTLWHFYITVVGLWLRDVGRFMPLNLGSVYGLFYLTHNALIVKSTQLVLIVLNVATFAVLARRLTRSLDVAVVATACVAMTLQVRFPIDPIAGFAPLLPLTLEFVLLALVFQLAALQLRKRAYLWAAVMAFACAALTYEVTYAFVILHVYLAFRRGESRKAALLQSGYFCLPIAALTVLNLVLRHVANVQPGSFYAISAFSAAYFHTLAIQLIAALPYSYAYFLPIPTFSSISTVLLTRPAVGYSLGLLFGVIAFIALRRFAQSSRVPEERNGLIDTAIVGALLWLLAAPIMASSPRWQAELVFGQAYLPVYLEYFGVALLAAAAFASIARAIPRPAIAALCAIVIGGVTTITYQTNRPNLLAYQPIWTQGRLALEEAVKSGLFGAVPDTSTVVLDHSYAWDFEAPEPQPNSNSRYLLFMLLGKRYAISSIDSAAVTLCPSVAVGERCDLKTSNVFAYFSDNAVLVPGERWTRVAAIDSVAPNADGPPELMSTSVVVAARGAPAVTFSAAATAAAGTIAVQSAGGTLLGRVRSCLALPADLSPSGSPVNYGAGFYGEEHSGADIFRWSKRDSEMSFHAGSQPVSARLSMRISAFVPNVSVSLMAAGNAPERIAATPLGTPVSIPFSLKPDSTVSVRMQLEGKPFTAARDPRQLAFRLVDVELDSHCGRR